MSDLTGPVEAAARAAYDRREIKLDGPTWEDVPPLQKHYWRETLLPVVAAAIAQYETERADQ